jgi:hypothetical protein
MAKSPLTWLPLWTRALEVEIGIAFIINGVRRDYFRNTMYEARKAAGDPRLEDLIMFLPAAPHDNEIWICKKQVELDASA